MSDHPSWCEGRGNSSRWGHWDPPFTLGLAGLLGTEWLSLMEKQQWLMTWAESNSAEFP